MNGQTDCVCLGTFFRNSPGRIGFYWSVCFTTTVYYESHLAPDERKKRLQMAVAVLWLQCGTQIPWNYSSKTLPLHSACSEEVDEKNYESPLCKNAVLGQNQPAWVPNTSRITALTFSAPFLCNKRLSQSLVITLSLFATESGFTSDCLHNVC